MINIKKLEGFQWDEGNSEKNPRKHGILNIEAEQIFFNEPLIVAEDHIHSITDEARYSALGTTDTGRNVTVIFTARKNLIRLISARLMSKRERNIYNEKAKKNT